jgi:hypothetical protein
MHSKNNTSLRTCERFDFYRNDADDEMGTPAAAAAAVVAASIFNNAI